MINVKQWMELKPEVRTKIAKDFQLQKTGRMGIQNNKIIADGYNQTDLLKINLQNLQTLMDSSVESFDDLFLEYSDLIYNTIAIVEPILPKVEPIIVDLKTIEEFNPNVAASGDKETYFGTKIKPVTYKPNEKTKKRN